MNNVIARQKILVLIGSLLCACIGTGSVGATATKTAGEIYETALQLKDKNDPIALVLALKNALQQDPQHLSSRILLAQIYLEQGLGAAAEESLRVALSAGADPNEVTPMLGKALLHQGKADKVIEEISARGLANEHAAEVYAQRAEAYLDRRRPEMAKLELHKALQLTPRGLQPGLVQIKALMQANNFAEAKISADQLVTEHPTEAEAWLALSNVGAMRGDLEGALKGYGRVLDMDSHQLTARIERLTTLFNLHRDKDAQIDVDFLQKEFPNDPRASYMRAVWLSHNGTEQATQQALEKVVDAVKQLNDKAFAEDPMLNLMTGLTYYGLQNFEQARTRLQAYVNQVGGDVGARRALGDTLLRLGDSNKAIEILLPAVNAAPDDNRGVAMLANAYALSGRSKQALQLLNQAIARGKKNDTLRSNLALLEIQNGQLEKGLPELASAFHQAPENAELGIALVTVYLSTNDAKNAIATADKLLAAHPQSPDYLNLSGAAYLAANGIQRARDLFTRATVADPRFVPAQLNLAKLDLQQGQVESARKGIAPLLRAAPESPKLLLEMSRVELAAGHAREGLKLAEHAYHNAPKDLDIVFHLLDTEIVGNYIGLANALISETELAIPGNFQVMARHAGLMLRQQDAKSARPILQHMLQIDGITSAQMLQIAELQSAAGFHDDAAYTLSQLLQKEPGNVGAQLSQITNSLRRDDPTAALQAADDFLNRFPDKEPGWRLRGEANFALKRFEAAAMDFDHALSLGITQMAIVRGYEVLKAADHGVAARARLQHWLNAHPEDRAVKELLAVDFLGAKEYANAETTLIQLLKATPENPRLLNELAVTQYQLGRQEALGSASKAHQLDLNNPAIDDTLGWILVGSGKPQEALPLLRDASTRAAESPEIRYHLATCLSNLGRTTEARAEIERALRTDSDFPERKAAISLDKLLKSGG